MPEAPLGWTLALIAGMVAAFNPCGIAVLPAYVAHLLGVGTEESASWSMSRVWMATRRGLAIGLMMTAGFLTVFLLAGIILSTAGRWLVQISPWLAVAVGVMLVIYGVVLLFGKNVSIPEVGWLSRKSRLQTRQGRSRFYVYGIGYALASLGCTLPVFLAVVFQSFVSGDMALGVLAFVFYSLGMGLVIILISILTLWTREAAQRVIRNVLPYMKQLSAVVMVVAGAYLIYYWLLGPGNLLLS